MRKIIYGIHTVRATLEREPECILHVYLLKGYINRRLQQLDQRCEKIGIIIQRPSRQWLDEKAKGGVHQGVIACVKSNRRQCQEKDLIKLLTYQSMPLLLVLDGVTDPHNLGACLRTANAAGVHAVIVPRDRAAPMNAIAQKVASGASEEIPLIRVTNLTRTLRLLQENHVWIVGTVARAAHSLYKSKLTGSLALVMGGEGLGLRRLVRDQCDQLINIPMSGTLLSLNVSVAAGVCLFEALRQRNRI
ncbi:23S rRNA (guanosine(2251)-2'-O)-methyltransferase RlmB [Candidatus Steffania adelgidicola]|uniref:23S rRNA (guanosine(2251)-2'-O)-methyltransferase RlmB n=1 Tax=Candidatus Steffania adelgidicola TaxID=1076626 RepID=UPI001D025504|nr:23S rRNA (guanosine(2251)-2'-O)-methyltransferase RlmB [Candidatus Steffania adelgidicola]UDG79517.1 23S rRNA (guanosine-2'-O-)-methyltransferase RlmB [Candidatus Steffania adelgidicola]